MVQQTSVQIQLLYVPDCPLVEKVQSMLKKCLAQTQIDAVVEELVGNYNSPTLLVDGFDVTGHLRVPEGQISCRLDLPTEEQILAALRGLTALSCEGAFARQLQATAFQSLLHTAKPLSLAHLATKMNTSTGIISGCIEELRQTGHVQLDSEGSIVGTLGLSLSPTIHEMSVNGRRFWARCAFDVIGIFGALHASGFVRSQDPNCNETLRLEFINGNPQERELKVFMADQLSRSSVCDDWCLKVNFFISAESAQSWCQRNGMTGSLISVGNLAPAAREVWSRFLSVAQSYGYH